MRVHSIDNAVRFAACSQTTSLAVKTGIVRVISVSSVISSNTCSNCTSIVVVVALAAETGALADVLDGVVLCALLDA
jgi:hypothetical protein